MWNHLTWAVRFSWPNIRKLVDPKPPKTGAARPPVERMLSLQLDFRQLMDLNMIYVYLCVPLGETHFTLQWTWLRKMNLLVIIASFQVGLSHSSETQSEFSRILRAPWYQPQISPYQVSSSNHLRKIFWTPFFGRFWEHPILQYPLVNIQKTMEDHHFQWVNPLFLWSFSIAMFDITRG